MQAASQRANRNLVDRFAPESTDTPLPFRSPATLPAPSWRRAFRVGRRSSDDLDRPERRMPCEAGAENRGITVRACIDAEVDGGPTFRINHHPEFDHLQPKALHIGQKLGRRGKRIRGNGPEESA
jgi:hypothetical protein